MSGRLATDLASHYAIARPSHSFRVQFLDASAAVIVEWHADADDVAGAIALIDGVSWLLDAARMRILDSTGLMVHESGRADGR